MNGLRQAPLLGVLGGMGPLATVDFLGKLTRQTLAPCDQQHIAWITASQPGIPDRSAAILAGNDGPLPYLAQGAAWLATQGVRLIAIPCNTSHFWYPRIQAGCPVPILHIADATVDELQRCAPGAQRVVVLATRGTVRADIYGSRLAAHGLAVTHLGEDEQSRVDAVIEQVKAGQVDSAGQQLASLLAQLVNAGVDTAVLACTELPIAQSSAWCETPSGLCVLDTSLALVNVSLRLLQAASSPCAMA